MMATELKQEPKKVIDCNWYQVSSWKEWGNIFTKIKYFEDTINKITNKHDIKYKNINTTFPGQDEKI